MDTKGKFSHTFYDDITETLFIYFEGGTVQKLGTVEAPDRLEEFAVWLEPDQYEKMRQYFIDHPTPPVL